MDRYLITEYKGSLLAGLWHNDHAGTLSVFGKETGLGDIYVGKVKKVLKNIKACFVDVRPGFSCYLSLDRGHALYPDGHRSPTVKEGDELVVQIVRDATAQKAPVLSCFFDFGEHDDPRGLYHDIMKIAPTRTCYSRLYRAASPLVKELLSLNTDNLEMIRIDVPEVYEYLKSDDLIINAGLDKLLSLYTDEYPMSKLYSINSELDRALGKTVHMKSGAGLVVEHTEALWVIDVNSAKSIKGDDRDAMIYKTNLEAAEEIAHQLRLRNMSGIIVIDFINMRISEHREVLLEKLQEFCDKDAVRVKVEGMTSLGLVEVTRKRVRSPLYEQIRALDMTSENA